MGDLINLNSPKPITDADIPAAIARDVETAAAVSAHTAAADPHPVYLTQSEGDGRYRQSVVSLVDADIPASIARDTETVAAIAALLAQAFVCGQSIRSKGAESLTSVSSENQAGIFATDTIGGGYWFLVSAQAPTNQKIVDCGIDSTGLVTFRRVTDNYGAVVANIFQVDGGGNLKFFGFTTLGDNVAVKKKLISGTTSATSGGTATVAHGIDSTKIVSITGTIFHSLKNTVPFSSRQTNYSTYLSTDVTNINITNESGNSAGILSKPFFVLIEYTA